MLHHTNDFPELKKKKRETKRWKETRKEIVKGNLEQLTERIVLPATHEKIQARIRWSLEGLCKAELSRTKLRTL